MTAVATYLPDHSQPGQGRYAFSYTIRISNEGEKPAQLQSRHWIITDGDGNVQHVRGEGVVGEQPLVQPGRQFQYTSGAVLRTPHGAMHGSYHFTCPDGTSFDAVIAPFPLSMPNALN